MNRGYTLIELLLVTVFILVISSLVILNFSKSYNESRLNDGVTNIETLLRFSKAKAQNSGKVVKVLFPTSVSGDAGESIREKYHNKNVVVTVDESVDETVDIYVDIINENVIVDSSESFETVFWPNGDVDNNKITVSSVEIEDNRRYEISITPFSIKTKMITDEQ